MALTTEGDLLGRPRFYLRRVNLGWWRKCDGLPDTSSSKYPIMIFTAEPELPPKAQKPSRCAHQSAGMLVPCYEDYFATPTPASMGVFTIKVEPL